MYDNQTIDMIREKENEVLEYNNYKYNPECVFFKQKMKNRLEQIK